MARRRGIGQKVLRRERLFLHPHPRRRNHVLAAAVYLIRTILRRTRLIACLSFTLRAPILCSRRRESTARSWNTSATDGLASLFLSSGSIRTVPLNCKRAAFEESGISKDTPPSADTNIAGRTPACWRPGGVVPRATRTTSPAAWLIACELSQIAQSPAGSFAPTDAFTQPSSLRP